MEEWSKDMRDMHHNMNIDSKKFETLCPAICTAKHKDSTTDTTSMREQKAKAHKLN